MNRNQLIANIKKYKRIFNIAAVATIIYFFIFLSVVLLSVHYLEQFERAGRIMKLLPLITIIVIMILPLLVGIMYSKWWTRKNEFMCPLCKNEFNLSGAMIVVVSGKCGYCGKRIIDDNT